MERIAAYVRAFEIGVVLVVGSFVANAIALVLANLANLVPLVLVLYIAIALGMHVAFFYPRAVVIARSSESYVITISTPVTRVSVSARDIALSDINVVGAPILGIRLGSLTLGVFKSVLKGKVVCFAKHSTGILCDVSKDLSIFVGTKDLDALLTCLEGGGAICIA